MNIKSLLNKNDTLNLPSFRIDAAFDNELSILEQGSFYNVFTKSALFFCDREGTDENGFEYNSKLDEVLVKAQELFGYMIPALRDNIYYVHAKTENAIRSNIEPYSVARDTIRSFKFKEDNCALSLFNNLGVPGARLTITSKDGHALDIYFERSRIIYCVVLVSNATEFVFSTKNDNHSDILNEYLGKTIVNRILSISMIMESLSDAREDFHFWGTPIKVTTGDKTKLHPNTLTIYSV